TLLKENLHALRFESDAEARETTLFTLGDLYYRQKQYRKAVDPLAEAIGPDPCQVPVRPRSIRARLQLGESFRHLASQPNLNDILEKPMSDEMREQLLKVHKDFLLKAADEYQWLGHLLDKIQADKGLGEETRRDLLGELTAEERAQ